MLRELHISNLAVISDVRIELHGGLNCFTGATGAGKSLVIGALEVLLGLRSPAEMLRPGVEEGRVSGVFEGRDPELLRRIEAITDVQVTADGGELLLTRRLYASGPQLREPERHPITLAMLKQVAEHLVDVHGQHDHQYLLKRPTRSTSSTSSATSGRCGGSTTTSTRASSTASSRLAELSASRTLREQQLELYRFQADEIDTAELDPAEYAELEARASVLEQPRES
jgi:DNA repair protein RecN (Recombination protein N)